MNEELYLLMNEVNTEGANSVEYAFGNSSRMLRFIEFLKSLEGTFKTQKAISIIYKEEVGVVDYKKLINRYYKLRQELMEWLYNYLKKTEHHSSKEEQQLNFIQYLISKNQFKEALDRLAKLEEECRALNIIELLPNIIEHILHCKQAFFLGESLDLTLDCERLWKAISCHQDLQKLNYYHIIAYEAKSSEAYKDLLSKIKRLISSHKTMPRFEMIYRYTAFLRGMTLPEIVENSSNALMRHLNRFEELRKQYPKIPGTDLKVHNVKLMTYNILVIKSVFFYNRGKFNKAAQAVLEQNKLRKANPNVPFAISASVLKNSLIFLATNRQYKAALHQWDELSAFLVKHEQFDRLKFIAYDKAMIYFFQFPEGSNMDDISLLLEEIERYILNGDFEIFMIEAKIWLSLILGKAVDLEIIQKVPRINQEYQMNDELLWKLIDNISTSNLVGVKENVIAFKSIVKKYKVGQAKLFGNQIIKIALHFLNQKNKGSF